MCMGGGIGVQKQKPSCRGLVFTNEWPGVMDLHFGNLVGLGRTQLEGVGVCNWMAHGWGQQHNQGPVAWFS